MTLSVLQSVWRCPLTQGKMGTYTCPFSTRILHIYGDHTARPRRAYTGPQHTVRGTKITRPFNDLPVVARRTGRKSVIIPVIETVQTSNTQLIRTPYIVKSTMYTVLCPFRMLLVLSRNRFKPHPRYSQYYLNFTIIFIKKYEHVIIHE